ncbi:MAG: tripartite tricarboxylate transporter substrate binding protein, partial [Burkholderiales bacterium]|nr:tripartite tricarboxylate transporter substrate binding protein [Burkholderiales bacterium]
VQDSVAPVTNASLLGSEGLASYFRSAVQVTLVAKDACGVQGTTLAVDDAAPLAYADPVQVGSEGSHRIVFHSTDLGGNVEADKVLKRAPMFTLDQLKPVARFTADPTALVVRADSPWKTYKDFMAAVKAKPGTITFGSSGNYGTMHVPMEQLKVATNSFMLHVPYTGAGPAVLALLGGQIDALSTGPSSVMQHVRAGKLRVLAHWGEGRLAALPEVPSFKELGVPISYSQWAGLFVPAATPEAVVTKLRQAAKAASEDARAKQALAAAGTSFQYQDAPEFERFVQADARSMAALVQRIGRLD